MPVNQRLDALTSLRFFAAAVIVIFHSAGLFGLDKDRPIPIESTQAVSFFFVLSGFILAYIYPKLETWSEIRGFWRARFARIWPALVASFILAFWLFSLRWDYKAGIANLLMVHAWIPFPRYFFSYNNPSWSISTEFFFYLAFPFLIYQWEKTWRVKLMISGIIVALMILASNVLHLPSYKSLDDADITIEALLFIHPASRIFEFILGIGVASYWRKQAGNTQWSKSRATLYEIGAVLLVAASMHFIFPLETWIHLQWGAAAASWLQSSGSVFTFGLLIYVIAMGRGRISAWLSHPVLVLLGEISFSLYMLHFILLQYYRVNFDVFPHLPNLLALAIFWILVLIASYLMWALIEMPCRRLLLGQAKRQIHGTTVMEKSWASHLNLNPKTISAAVIFICSITAIYFSMGNIHRMSAADSDAMTPKELQSVVGTNFGNLFLLRGIKIVRKPEELLISLAWQNLIEQKLIYTNRLYLTDINGNILLIANLKQPLTRTAEKQGMIWWDSIAIPTDKLRGRESKLAIAIYQDNDDFLTIDRGERDWNNHRLLFNLVEAINPAISTISSVDFK